MNEHVIILEQHAREKLGNRILRNIGKYAPNTAQRPRKRASSATPVQKCRKSHVYELEGVPGGRAKRRTFGEMYCAFGTWPDSAVSRYDI